MNRPIVQFFNDSIVNESMTQFSANALYFGESFPSSGAPCRVEVEIDALTVQLTSPYGSRQETVPFTALAVSAGGLDHDYLVVKWVAGADERTLYLKDPDLIIAFRRSAPPELTAHVERTAQKVRRARHSRRTALVVASGVLAGLVLTLWFGSDTLVEMAVARIPVEWEQKIGESAQKEFLAGQPVLHEGAAVTAVQEITSRLTDRLQDNPYKFQVAVVKNDVVNAFALPGGYVVVFTGLLAKAESPEEVAGVLGHELNHVLQRHGLERIVKTLGLMAVVTILVGDQQGLIRLAKELGIELATMKFSREQETEADVTAVRLLHRAKIAPNGMIQFFERLSKSEQGRIELLSTHPMSAYRAERIKAEVAALPKQTPEPFGFDWKRVQESIDVRETAKP